MSTPPRTARILPLTPAAGARSVDAFIVSPPAPELIGHILPSYLRMAVYRALVENAAGEQGSRRAAMKSATDNAGEILDTLTRTYNRGAPGADHAGDRRDRGRGRRARMKLTHQELL